jgi:hypothetical protein
MFVGVNRFPVEEIYLDQLVPHLLLASLVDGLRRYLTELYDKFWPDLLAVDGIQPEMF